MEWLTKRNGALVKVFTVTGQQYYGRLTVPAENPEGKHVPEDIWVEVYNEDSGKRNYVNLKHVAGISIV